MLPAASDCSEHDPEKWGPVFGKDHAQSSGRTPMKLTRRTLVLGAITAPLAAQAQTPAWPPSNIRIVVAYPPGGSTDAMMRLIQPGLQQRLGTTVIIENRSGASGSVGTGAVAK